MPITQRNLYMVRDVLTGQFYSGGSRLNLTTFGRARIYSKQDCLTRIRNRITRQAAMMPPLYANEGSYWHQRINFAQERVNLEGNGVEIVGYTIEADTPELEE